MTLEEYISKYRRGNNALTMAEAKIAGIAYPMSSGWVKRNRLLEVDGVAMHEAKLLRRRTIAERRGKETKKEKRARLAIEASKLPSVTISMVIDVPAEIVTDAVHRHVNSSAFLASYEWRKLRFKALQKYGRRCQCCGATPASGALLNVDHIKPRRRFPSLALDINNLQILCEDCNHGKGNITADFR